MLFASSEFSRTTQSWDAREKASNASLAADSLRVYYFVASRDIKPDNIELVVSQLIESIQSASSIPESTKDSEINVIQQKSQIQHSSAPKSRR